VVEMIPGLCQGEKTKVWWTECCDFWYHALFEQTPF